jgi:BirA family biotin operon repressor/biotin-[acetyl-CoA-carboxylase] ligase
LLDAFLSELDRRYADLDAVVGEYRARLTTLGRRVRVEGPDGDLVGPAVGIGAAGQLQVEVDGGDVLEVHVGDVVHLRDA